MALKQVRTIFVSDLHLGHKNCKAKEFLAFLTRYEAPLIYLIGDIIDEWRLKLTWHWPQSHNDIIEEILRRARLGTTIIYILGNHDRFGYTQDIPLGNNIFIKKVTEHKSVDGKRYLILHGDGFDAVTHRTAWLLGTFHWLKFPDWGCIRHMRRQIARFVNWISSYEKALVAEAKGFDGVICGHSHKPEIKQIGESKYLNTGDWVDSKTAIIEELDGTLCLISEE